VVYLIWDLAPKCTQHPLLISSCAHVKTDVFSVYNAVGQVPVVHTLPEGESVAGVTSLADEVYVLREKERDQVEVYDVIYYRLQRRLTVPKIRWFVDMTSCEHYRCVYIADGGYPGKCIHRLDVQGAFTRWAVNDKPWGISVNAAHNVLVTCGDARKIKEFNSHGDLLRELTLPVDVINPQHAMHTRNGELLVCHDDAVHRVCKISADGRHIIKSHGGRPGSNIGQYKGPFHLVVDNNEFVFVADHYNHRVTLLSPTLDYIRQVVSPDDLQSDPDRLCLDIHRRRLYVVDNDIIYTTGRVVVFSV